MSSSKLLCLALFLGVCATGSAQSPEFRALWVDGFHAGIRTPAEVDQLVADAQRAHFNALIIQVRRRADALYTKSFEPPVDDPAYAPDFDALQYAIDAAHRAGIEVHAWANAMPVWRGGDPPPRDPRHVFNQHGPNAKGDDNWLTASPDGNFVFPVGYFLDPGHPAAADYIARVYLNLVKSYPQLDGIHFDYIRYPETDKALPRGAPVGYNPVSLARFRRATGRSDTPAPDDAQWINWRRQQVTQLVRRVYLEAKAINPRIKVTAALIPWGRPPASEKDFANTAPMQRIFQDWQGWLREGILDMAVPMNYARENDARVRNWFDGWIRFEKRNKHGRQIAVGLGAYVNSPEQVLAQIARARRPEGKTAADGVSFFSYSSMTRPRPEAPPAADPLAYLRDGTGGAPAAFASSVSVPAAAWIQSPRTGGVFGVIAAATPADGVRVRIRRAGWWPFRRSRTVLTDGNGYFGFPELKPSRYGLDAQQHGRSTVVVQAGQVARADVSAERSAATTKDQ
jgi:uncharacterized lipoprotein YddW (UPF0748 family)